MMRITRTVPEGSSHPCLRIEGRIVGDAVAELMSASVAALTGDEPLVLDCSGVGFIDTAAARAVNALVRGGAVVVGCSPFVAEILRAAASNGDGTTPENEESSLVAPRRRGAAAAFEDVVRLYGGRLLAVARRMLRTEEDARDAVQEAFISAFKSVARFQGDARLSTWLHRIVVNAALMRLRRQRRKPEESIDELLPRFDESGSWAEGEQPFTTPFDLLERFETRAIVHECLDRLPESYRAVVQLRDIEEFDTDETAAALGVSVSAVKTRLHRGRQALRTLLAQRLAPASSAAAGAVPAAVERHA
jgi:RNA polymerase sigma-70 factor (ECF subfamily)